MINFLIARVVTFPLKHQNNLFEDKVFRFVNELLKFMIHSRAMTAKIFFIFYLMLFHNLVRTSSHLCLNEIVIIAVMLLQRLVSSVAWVEFIPMHFGLPLLIQQDDKDSLWKWRGSLYIILTLFASYKRLLIMKGIVIDLMRSSIINLLVH